MPASTFSCPHCEAPLRAKDASLAGRTVECPDCRRSLKIVVDASRQLTVLPAPPREEPATSSAKVGVGVIMDAARNVRQRATRWQETLSDPLVVAWVVAGMLTIMLLVALWPRRDDAAREPDARPADSPIAASDAKTQNSVPLSIDEPPVKAPKPVVAAAIDPPAVHVVAEVPAVAEKPQSGIEPAIEPPPPPAPPVDVAANLAQPILRFDQSRAAPFRDLLLSLEEMAGVQIVYDQIDPATMQTAFDTRVSLSLERTTLGEILQETLKRVGLSFTIESDVIRLSLTGDNQPADAGRSPKSPSK